MMNKLLFISVISTVVVASEQKGGCYSYFNVVTGGENVEYRVTPCEDAVKILGTWTNADGVKDLVICVEDVCNPFGPFKIETVKALHKQFNEKVKEKTLKK
jgi:hypothetical protein